MMMRGMFIRGGWRQRFSKMWMKTKRTTKRTFIQVNGDPTPSSLTRVKWRKEAAMRMMIDLHPL